MKRSHLKIVIMGIVLLSTTSRADELQTAPFVDVEKYLGQWYEVASIPQVFQAGCVGVTAYYELNEDETISVKNSCFNYYFNREIVANGTARVVDTETNAKLKVKFFGPEGDYWVLDVASDYSWAIVGEPNRESLWILSRKPQMDSGLYNLLMERVESKFGYEVAKVKLGYQPAVSP